MNQPAMKLDRMSHDSVLDVTRTLARLGGDQQLFRELLEFVLEDAPPLMNELRRVGDLSDAVAVRSTAHALAGLLAGCGGVRAAQAARQIEKAVEVGDLNDLTPLVTELEREVDQLLHAAQLQLKESV
jgi:two-component system, sensor histidine kinase and response regulator